jgi:hypothetical protein
MDHGRRPIFQSQLATTRDPGTRSPVQGGGDDSADAMLQTVNFEVDVPAVETGVPEPGSMLLALVRVAVLLYLRRPDSLRQHTASLFR